jgi:hypothetical protein
MLWACFLSSTLIWTDFGRIIPLFSVILSPFRETRSFPAAQLDMMKAQIIAAVGLLLTLRAHGQNVIFSGTGFGTYYYDLQQVDACGTSFAAQNTGQLECSLETVLTLDQVNSDYVVAMNRTQLIGDMANYCGKKVIVSINGQPSSLPLFIGDGCERCASGSASSDTWDPNSAPGLDLSYNCPQRAVVECMC